MAKNEILIVRGIPITTFKLNNDDYISLTDIARNKNAEEPKDVVKNWMRSRTTIEFLGLWEQLNNADFKGVEFDSFMFEAGANSFTLFPTKWIETTHAKGILIHQNMPQIERLETLNQLAINQMKSLIGNKSIGKLK